MTEANQSDINILRLTPFLPSEREVNRIKKNELLDWVKGIRNEFKDTGWKNADRYVEEQRKGWG